MYLNACETYPNKFEGIVYMNAYLNMCSIKKIQLFFYGIKCALAIKYALRIFKTTRKTRVVNEKARNKCV